MSAKRIAVLGVVLLLLLGAMVLTLTVGAADPAPQTVEDSRVAVVDTGTVRTAAEKEWTLYESAFYGSADIYYTLVLSDTAETVTMTLRHSPNCVTLWQAYSTTTYTKTQAAAAGTVFTRVVPYGGCLGVLLQQSNAAVTSPVTSAVEIVFKNN